MGQNDRGYNSYDLSRKSFMASKDRQRTTEHSHAIDRTTTCPFLLRVFCREGDFHPVEAFDHGNRVPDGEIRIHTWMDATLREVADMIEDQIRKQNKVNDAERGRAGGRLEINSRSRLEMALVYPNRSGKNIMREIGSVRASQQGKDDETTLKNVRLEAGDFLSIAIKEDD